MGFPVAGDSVAVVTGDQGVYFAGRNSRGESDLPFALATRFTASVVTVASHPLRGKGVLIESIDLGLCDVRSRD